MSQQFLLSRYQLIPQFDFSIPNDIIMQLCSHLGIKTDLNLLKNDLHKAKMIQLIKHQHSSDDYADVPIFINPDLKIKWKAKEVYSAYQHIAQYYDHTHYETIKVSFSYGAITPQQLENYDLILTYGACRYFNIDSLINSSNPPDAILRCYLTRSLHQLKNDFLVNLKLFSKSDLFKLTHTHKSEQIKIDYDKLNQLTQYDFGMPKNDYEAIVYGAFSFGIDLTRVSTPLFVYNQIIKQPSLRNNVPLLSQEFNPNLNLNFYQDDILDSILLRYGLESVGWSKMEKYSKCQEFYYLDTFETGIRRPLLNTTTPIEQNDIEMLPSVECLSYGNDLSGYWIYTFKELYLTFDYYKQPIQPQDPQKTFSKREIQQMINLCNIQSKYATKMKSSLLYIISFQMNLPKEIDLLRKIDPKVLQEAFKLFTEAVMFMRGWEGNGSYPLEETPVKDQNKVNARVNDGMSLFIEYLEKNELKALIWNLPLVEYKNNQFFQNKLPEKGLTIGKRIEILSDLHNINSCIRTSSNWFLASIYKYSVILKLKPLFEIEKARKIG